MMESPRCVNCGTGQFVTLLHRERGGPMVCPRCRDGILLEISRQRTAQEAIISAFGLNTLEVLVGVSGGQSEPQLSVELLDDILALVHPDNHPPERTFLAHRVTAELLALKATLEVLALSSSAKSIPTVTTRRRIAGRNGDNVSQRSRQFHPCNDCRQMAPRYYCDDCRQRWERERHEKREKDNAAARQRRARNRLLWQATCVQCGKPFIPKRRDANYCSGACRQKAHRERTVVA